MTATHRVRTRTVGEGPTALGEGGPFTLVVDRPESAGGGGLGFNGQVLCLSMAACVSNDLYREAATMGIGLSAVEVTVDGYIPARGTASTPIVVDLVVRGDASDERLRALVAEVERVAEIPRTIRDASLIDIRTLAVESGIG